MKVAYLGPIGSYSHRAALSYGNREKIARKLIAMDSFYDIIEAIEEMNLEEGILPIENSTEGAVTQVMDLLLETKLTKIQGEMILPIEHNLLGLGEIEEIKFIYSHPQAIEQCRHYLIKNYPHISLFPCESSSRACEIVLEKGKAYGAIANRAAEEVYGLKKIKANIHDNILNQTRFLVLGRTNMSPTGKDKTSVTFSFKDDHPGNLFLVLQEFALAAINLTRIESRPAKAELGKYIFYIDFHGHQLDEEVRGVLDRIKGMTSQLKVLGSYPLGKLDRG